MTKKSIKWFVFLVKVIKCLKIPLKGYRKLMRKSNIRQLKVVVGSLLMSSCVIILLYYWFRSSSIPRQHHTTSHRLKRTTTDKTIKGTPLSHVNLSEFYNNAIGANSLELDNTFMPVRIIDTPGCKIPWEITSNLKNYKPIRRNVSCGERGAFLTKIDIDKVQILIKDRIMKNYLRKSVSYDCCYRFLIPSISTGTEDIKHRFTKCKMIHNGGTFTLKSDFVNIKCFEYDKQNVSYKIYDDIYPFTKKITATKQQKSSDCKNKYNILMLGIDSMSLSRFKKTMHRTSVFFRENYWAVFRGYHKVADDTFSNLMSTLTGKDIATIKRKCYKKMDQCIDVLVWSKFKQAGYVTAFGEDYLRLPDSFSNAYAFHKPPTDHYMKPFFVKRETEMFNSSLVCAGKLPSGQQILNYALDFATTYRRESFFGLFWINSFTHNEENHAEDGDKILENFLNQLTYTGVLFNTFIIVFSNYGIRYGKNRLEMGGYYDERMPCLFVWVPILFKGLHGIKYSSVQINQFRLVTPYDLYNTLVHVQQLSTCTSNTKEVVADACPNCQSIFDVISDNRTCQHVAINKEWCSCHNLYPLPKQDQEGMKAVTFVVSRIQTMIKLMKIKRCWGCINPLLGDIVRISFYYEKENTSVYYVIVFTMTPSNMTYEATVKRKGVKMELVGQASVISSNRNFGNCTIRDSDRWFCVCRRLNKCTIDP